MQVRSSVPANAAYSVERTEDGLCDIIILRNPRFYPLPDGGEEYDVDVYTLENVPYRPGLEADIEANYEAWAAHAAAFEREKEVLRDAVEAFFRSIRKEGEAYERYQ